MVKHGEDSFAALSSILQRKIPWNSHVLPNNLAKAEAHKFFPPEKMGLILRLLVPA